MKININIYTDPIFEIPQEIIVDQPQIINSNNSNFIDYHNELPSNKIFKLKNIYINKNLILNSDNEFLSQFSWFGSDISKYSLIIKNYVENYFNQKLETIILNGTSLYLGSTWGDCNIGHNVLDGLTKMAGYDMANIDLSSIDHFLVHHDPEIIPLLLKMKIPLDRIKNINNFAYKCENIIISEIVGRKRQYKKIIANYFNKILDKSLKQDNTKIFLNNRKKRKPINIKEIKNILLQYQYNIHDKHPSFEIFAKSNCVISPHSSTLYKLIFCNQNTKVLELISNDHMYSYYYEICRIFNLNYTGLVCEAKQQRLNKMMNDFIVNINLLEEWIQDN